MIDTHCHLEWSGFAGRLPDLLARARRAGVAGWVLPGTSEVTLRLLAALAASRPDCWQAPGIHPQHAGVWDRVLRKTVADAVRGPRVVAIGEIGLDRQIPVDPARQRQAFEEQLQLAADHDLPVILHVRRAHGTVLEILQKRRVGRAIWHGFSGSGEILTELQRLGHHVSFGGSITWPAARKAERLWPRLDLDRALVETDAPDMPPHPHRGRTCLPEHLPLVVRHLAGVLRVPAEALATRLGRNARTAFQLDRFDEPR